MSASFLARVHFFNCRSRVRVAGAGGVRLRVGKHDGPAARSEGTCTAIEVAAEPGGKVSGFANVQGSVRAAEDIDDMHDGDDGIVWASNASEDSVR
jgi:hypothetical protein